MNRVFTRDELEELDVPYTVVDDKITSHSRWAVHHESVFEYEGKYYSIKWMDAATELQDTDPFGYEDEVICTEVEQREVTRLEWVPKEE